MTVPPGAPVHEGGLWVRDLTGLGPERTQELRKWVAVVLPGLGAPHLRAVQLVLTELVTNAHQHGGGARVVRLWCPGMSCLVRVEVDDNAVSRMATRGGGRGMLLIAGFARRWGIGSAPGSGKRVWADVECGVLPGVGCAAAS